MGELVAGIGDEVLLFGAFLVLSFIFVAFLTTRRGRSTQLQAPRQPVHQDDTDQPAQVQDETNSSQPQQSEQPPPSSSSNDLGTSPQTEDSQLRSRFNRSEEETVSSLETQGEGSRSVQGDLINIRLISSGSTMTLQVRTDCTLDQLRRSNFQEELAQNCPVRFIYRGRVLNDDSRTLQELGITDGCAMHIHVGRPRPQGQQDNQEVNDEFLDLSRLFVPLFGVILGIVWVAMLCYPQVFSLMTKLFLFALSLGYVMLTYVTTFT